MHLIVKLKIKIIIENNTFYRIFGKLYKIQKEYLMIIADYFSNELGKVVLILR